MYTSKEYKLLGQLLSANMNSVADQAIGIIMSGTYIIDKIIATNASANMTGSIAAGGIYTGANKTGTNVVSAAQTYTSLTSASKWMALTLAVTSDTLTAQTLYFALTTANGSAATCDIYIYGYTLT